MHNGIGQQYYHFVDSLGGIGLALNTFNPFVKLLWGMFVGVMVGLTYIWPAIMMIIFLPKLFVWFYTRKYVVTYVFTKTHAVRLILGFGIIFLCAFCVDLFFSVKNGWIDTFSHRGGPASHRVYLDQSKGEFYWALFEVAAGMAGIWATLSQGIFALQSTLSRPSPPSPPTTGWRVIQGAFLALLFAPLVLGVAFLLTKAQ